MSKKKAEAAVSETVDETAVSDTPTSPAPVGQLRNIIGAATEHMRLAAAMLRSKGGAHAEPCAFVAAELERRVDQLEKLNE